MKQLALTFLAILAVTSSAQAQPDHTIEGSGTRKIDPAHRIS